LIATPTGKGITCHWYISGTRNKQDVTRDKKDTTTILPPI